MKNYKNRIAFGAEVMLVQATSQRCSDCDVLPGQLHKAGCASEECPGCGNAVVGCCCEILFPGDGELVIHGLYRQFSSLEKAIEATGEERCRKGRTSYLQHAVMRYIFDNVPEAARSEISRLFQLRFPELIPRLKDENGRGYYTAEQLSKALNIPLQEVNERIEAMVTAGNRVPVGNGKKLRRIH